MPNREQRARVGQVRAVDTDGDTGSPNVRLRLITPDVVDDYGSVWMAHALDKGLGTRMPVLGWAHDWSDPIGRAVEFWVDDEGPEALFEFDDFAAVPRARQAHAQVRSGTIQDCSVGFYVPEGGRRLPTEADSKRWPGVREVIEEAVVDEVSLVLRGAVPGARVLAVRSPSVTVDTAVELARRIAAGEITHDEGKAALALLAEEDVSGMAPAPDPDPDPEGFDPATAPIEDLTDDAIDAAVDVALGRSRRR